MRKMALVVVACGALAAAGYSQASSGRVIETHFKVVTQVANEKPYRLAVLGRVQAKKHKCVARRKVRLYFNRMNKRHLSDSGWSSRTGEIGLKGRWHAVPRRVIVKVRRKRVAAPGHSYRCSRVRTERLGLTR